MTNPMKTPTVVKPTVTEVIFEMIKLRAGDSIRAGWDERARAAIIQHTNERAAFEAVVEAVRDSGYVSGWPKLDDALAALTAVRGGVE